MMKRIFIKEWLEMIRTRKLMVLFLVPLFFALSDPVMLKLTPKLLENFSGIDLSGLIELSQRVAMVNFYGDMHQIFSIVVLVIITRLWETELKQETLIIPKTKDMSIGKLMVAKGTLYIGIISQSLMSAYLVTYAYSGLVFDYQVRLMDALFMGLLHSLFYAWLISVSLLLGLLLKSFFGTLFLSLLLVFSGGFIVSLMKIESYTPFELLTVSQVIGEGRTIGVSDYGIAIMVSLIMIGLFFHLMNRLAKEKELFTY